MRKYFNALRRAQIDIDVEPERYKHYLIDELPEPFKPMLDTRICGIGERIVFEPYTREMYEKTHRWMVDHRLFDRGEVRADYESAMLL